MTEFDPFHSNSPLIAYLDIKSPYAFIARDPTRDLARRIGIEIDWRPLTLDIPSYLGSARLDKKDRVVESHRSPKQWTSVKYSYRDARRYAKLNGYTLRGTVKIWDTSHVHIAMMWAKRQGEEVMDRYLNLVYERFWRREVDAEDLSVVSDLLVEAGVEASGFETFHSGEGRREHDRMQASIFEAGIFGVPTYIVAGEVFWGREHLPYIAWLLTGRNGPAPDIAYQNVGEGSYA